MTVIKCPNCNYSITTKCPKCGGSVMITIQCLKPGCSATFSGLITPPKKRGKK